VGDCDVGSTQFVSRPGLDAAHGIADIE
jgi:hypothetical protein